MTRGPGWLGQQARSLEFAGVEGDNPLGHTEEARQVGGQPSQAGDMREDVAQRKIVFDRAAWDQQKDN